MRYCLSPAQFEIDHGETYTLGSGGNNVNCKGKVSTAIVSVVKDLEEGTTQYEKRCAQTVLDASKKS